MDNILLESEEFQRKTVWRWTSDMVRQQQKKMMIRLGK